VTEKSGGEPALERSLSGVATTAHRLAILLAAGVAPHSAWGYLDDEETPLVARVAETIADGTAVPVAILASIGAMNGPESSAWRSLAAAWQVATTAGTPLAPSLRRMAGSLRALADAQREVRIALAGPVATARMVMVLPAVAVIFGILLGFDPLRTLFTTPFGLGCLGLGLVLIVAASRWNRRLVASAQPEEENPGLLCELSAIAVTGGASMSRARASVELALGECGIAVTDHDELVAERIIALSTRAGVPAAELLRAEAEELRRIARARSAKQAVVLAVHLMLPLGLCILPAFMLLGVAPMVLALLSSTISGF